MQALRMTCTARTEAALLAAPWGHHAQLLLGVHLCVEPRVATAMCCVCLPVCRSVCVYAAPASAQGGQLAKRRGVLLLLCLLFYPTAPTRTYSAGFQLVYLNPPTVRPPCLPTASGCRKRCCRAAQTGRTQRSGDLCVSACL